MEQWTTQRQKPSSTVRGKHGPSCTVAGWTVQAFLWVVLFFVDWNPFAAIYCPASWPGGLHQQDLWSEIMSMNQYNKTAHAIRKSGSGVSIEKNTSDFWTAFNCDHDFIVVCHSVCLVLIDVQIFLFLKSIFFTLDNGFAFWVKYCRRLCVHFKRQRELQCGS